MIRTCKTGLRALLLGVSAISVATAVAVPAAAQTTTGTITGRVTDANGAPVVNTVVTATNPATGQTARATSDATGTYVIAGLRPATYVIRSNAGGVAVEQTVVVQIGQRATLDLFPESAEPATATAPADAIVVTGRRLREVRTSEVATNVSQEQIRALPQTDRNFLSFARLAPGVTYNDSETDKEIRSGASTAAGVNVFIDGTSIDRKSVV